MKNIVLAVTAASGAAYADCFIRKISLYPTVNLTIVISDEARKSFKEEMDCEIEELVPRSQKGMARIFSSSSNQAGGVISVVSDYDMSLPFCSGSNAADVVVIMPCDMGTVAAMASGLTDDAVTKIAEVQLKERKKLIVVPRETPYNLIHLRNLTTLAENGAIIAPASPAFYHHPVEIEELVESFVARILEMSGIARLNDKFKKSSMDLI